MNNFLSWKQVLSCRFKMGTKSHPFVTEHCDWTFFTQNWLYLSEMPIRRKRIFERVLNRPYYTLNFGQTRVLASRESYSLNIFPNIFFSKYANQKLPFFQFLKSRYIPVGYIERDFCVDLHLFLYEARVTLVLRMQLKMVCANGWSYTFDPSSKTIR